MGVLYLLFLLLSLGCMVLLDHRFRLFFFADARRAAVVLLAGVLFFTGWDLAGIGADIFYRGETPFMLGLTLAPHLPVEEIFFLAFLCYLTMVVFALVRIVAEMVRRRTAGRPAPEQSTAGRSGTEQSTAGRSGTEQSTAGRSGTEQGQAADGAAQQRRPGTGGNPGRLK